MRALLLVTSAVACICVGHSSAATITFETAPFGNFEGPLSEAGFTYSFPGGDAFINDSGNPGQDIEGRISLAGTSGILYISSAVGAGATFFFLSLDFSAYSSIESDAQVNGGTQTLFVTGRRGGAVVGSEHYTLANTSTLIPMPGGFTYDNWTTEAASSLAGVVLDSLEIGLSGQISNQGGNRALNVDNIVLTALDVPVPEPASLTLLGLGAAGVLVARRRHRVA